MDEIVNKKSKNIKQFVINDENGLQRFLQPIRHARKLFKTDVSKDVYMKANLQDMNAKQETSKAKRDKMKEFERFLKYAGVDHLPPEKKKIYKYDSERRAEQAKLRHFQEKRKERMNDETQSIINQKLASVAASSIFNQ